MSVGGIYLEGVSFLGLKVQRLWKKETDKSTVKVALRAALYFPIAVLSSCHDLERVSCNLLPPWCSSERAKSTWRDAVTEHEHQCWHQVCPHFIFISLALFQGWVTAGECQQQPPHIQHISVFQRSECLVWVSLFSPAWKEELTIHFKCIYAENLQMACHYEMHTTFWCLVKG